MAATPMHVCNTAHQKDSAAKTTHDEKRYHHLALHVENVPPQDIKHIVEFENAKELDNFIELTQEQNENMDPSAMHTDDDHTVMCSAQFYVHPSDKWMDYEHKSLQSLRIHAKYLLRKAGMEYTHLDWSAAEYRLELLHVYVKQTGAWLGNRYRVTIDSIRQLYEPPLWKDLRRLHQTSICSFMHPIPVRCSGAGGPHVPIDTDELAILELVRLHGG